MRGWMTVAMWFSAPGARIRVVQEYERGVIFCVSRLTGARGPGLFFLIPGTVTMDVPAREAMTPDNVMVRGNAVGQMLDYTRATSLIARRRSGACWASARMAASSTLGSCRPPGIPCAA